MKIDNIVASGALVLLLAGISTGVADAAPANQPVLPVHPVASVQENLIAQQTFATQLGIATAVGGFGGTVLGAAIGCGVGGVVTVPTLVFVPAGCAAGAVAGAGIGGVIGTVVIGGPTLLIAGADLIGTMTATPGTTKFATH